MAALLPFTYPVDPTSCVICGCDEAGRGPLVGAVTAACVVLDPKKPIPGLNDSKKLSAVARERLAAEIKAKALAFGLGMCLPYEIDQMNILAASMEAMRRAYFAMRYPCGLMLVDGNKVPADLPLKAMAVVKGDAKVPEIAAASILAKTMRDAQLIKLARFYPEYGFARHKGYPTAAHLECLKHLPLLDCYRFSYAPIARLKAEGHPVIKTNPEALAPEPKP